MNLKGVESIASVFQKLNKNSRKETSVGLWNSTLSSATYCVPLGKVLYLSEPFLKLLFTMGSQYLAIGLA